MLPAMKKILLFFSFFLLACAAQTPTPPPVPGFDADLSAYSYPFPVSFHTFEAQAQSLRMAYMNLPAKSGAPVIVLLHGKNFGGFYFAALAERLQKMGYRVFIPDQIGFGKSTKPKQFQYSFQALATFTDQLLEKEGITNYTLGHSMGGMLATRMALLFPEKVKKLILVNPIGLEDWKTLVPYRPVDQVYRSELQSNAASIKKYQSEAYYSGGWDPAYDELIKPAVGWTLHSDYPLVAWNSALTFDMIFTQPVFYEFKNVKVPTALLIGQKDKTALGKAWASPAAQKSMGNYPVLGRQAARLIPRAKLYALEGLGHVPFIENLDRFMKEAMEPALR